MVIGSTGTGKSALLYEIKHYLAQKNLGVIVITAYTGVAVAPFGGPTILALFSLWPSIAKHEHLTATELPDHKVDQVLEKFLQESGVSLDEISGLVIDEITFNDAKLYGHLCKRLYQLLLRRLAERNPSDVEGVGVAGGLPLMLLGDCHQKNACGGTAWYKNMVDLACGEKSSVDIGATSAAARGIKLLCSARRVILTRLMRAQGDKPFIAFQLHMRRTDVDNPVSQALIDKLHTVRRKDLLCDEGWRYAPIGVLTHFERDFLNVFQLENFARTFDLPLFKWKLKLNDAPPLGGTRLDDLSNEIHRIRELQDHQCGRVPSVVCESQLVTQRPRGR